MESKVLKATRRTVTGKNVKALRRQGQLPAVLYGHNVDPISITLDTHATTLLLTGLSASAIVTVELDGQQHAALVREKQKNYVKNSLLHVDFQVVSLNEVITARVRIESHGVSTAVKDYNAVIVHNLNEVEVEALPRDLPEVLVVDVAKLAHVGDAIYVRDLEVSDNVKVLTPGDEIVVVATGAAPEIEEPVEAGDTSEPEVIERGKKEEEE